MITSSLGHPNFPKLSYLKPKTDNKSLSVTSPLYAYIYDVLHLVFLFLLTRVQIANLCDG